MQVPCLRDPVRQGFLPGPLGLFMSFKVRLIQHSMLACLWMSPDDWLSITLESQNIHQDIDPGRIYFEKAGTSENARKREKYFKSSAGKKHLQKLLDA